MEPPRPSATATTGRPAAAFVCLLALLLALASGKSVVFVWFCFR
jgi:hypothetical protein